MKQIETILGKTLEALIGYFGYSEGLKLFKELLKRIK